MTAYLAPISDREPLRWVLSEQRTAFPAIRAREAERLKRGDELLLYVTRGCFRNPTRDRGRVAGLATVIGPSQQLKQPIEFGGRQFTIAVPLRIELLAPARDGVELAPLVARLDTFPKPHAWSAHLRRALVPLTRADATGLKRRLRKVASPYPDQLQTYAA